MEQIFLPFDYYHRNNQFNFVGSSLEVGYIFYNSIQLSKVDMSVLGMVQIKIMGSESYSEYWMHLESGPRKFRDKYNWATDTPERERERENCQKIVTIIQSLCFMILFASAAYLRGTHGGVLQLSDVTN